MATLLRMPEVSADASTAVLQEWTVADNVPFAAGDAIATIETDKAVVDIEADQAGAVLKRLVDPGTAVAVGVPIAVLGTPGEAVPAGLLDEVGVAEGDEGTPAPAQAVAPRDGERRLTSPLARRLAREAGLDVDEITGTGPGGRIVRRDVEAAVAAQAMQSDARATAQVDVPAAIRATAKPVREQAAEYTDVPHSRMRRAVASRLTGGPPCFDLRATVDVGELLALRARLNDLDGVRVSINDLLLKAAALAHTRVPEMNVVWTEDAVRSFPTTDIAVAVATDTGLVTPVLTDVAGRTVTSVAEQTRDLAERARAGTLRQDELTGGTLTVTNLGAHGVEDFTAVLNPPHTAILAIGAARKASVVRADDRVSVATVVSCTLTVDHRPVDGAVAARWLAVFTDAVRHPLRIVA
nr:dihydrolipoamide acetyltransferase family protein [Kibdelosporangium sp. MJ126-NF4]CEL13348.1 Dihydrolipoamide acetyltransferase component of pyruvate dehydrogenase complex [Kibdelosporangium sp. MJ126-NF4]CTQ99038.1 Dihydrolipoamide acetyltransferase component of pyruvate dehydrogenase complex (EC 2.3.1.12) [Kibdelosporangium sp. MJ126-NF4]